MRVCSPDRRTLVAAIAALSIIGLAYQTHAQTTCPVAGERPATASDAVVQTGQLPVGTCYNPNTVGINQTSEQAKQDLKGMVCNSGVNIDGLDQNFAVCADKFMKALRAQSPAACVRDGYRSVAQQAAACQKICNALSCPGKCAPPGYSYHQKGLAVDVDVHMSVQTSWQIAQSSTGGGIQNPTGLHSSDPNHFQATGSTCSGAPVPQQSNPTDYYTPTLSQGTLLTPTQNSAIPPGYCLINQQPIIYAQCSPQMQTAPTPTQPAPIQQPTTQPAQPTQPGSVTTPSITPTLPLTVPTSSASSIISSLLQPTPITLPPVASSATQALTIITNLGAASSGSPLINSSLYNIITNILPGNLAGTTQSSYPATQTNYVYSGNTFGPDVTQYSPSYSPQLFQILQPLKNALQGLLSFLRSL